jgi:uncharacterized membrane protein YeaQ/YmgE (transglycosylase-associated protein family)
VRLDSVLGWMAIGAAASLAGMIWPFRRGTTGLVVNFVAGVLGALLGGALSSAFFAAGGRAPSVHLLSAAVFALGALAAVHAVWLRVGAASGRRGSPRRDRHPESETPRPAA